MVVVVEMHTVAFAIAPHLALGTLALASPPPVAEGVEPRVPHLPNVVGVDVALVETCPNACATRYGSVYLDAYDADAGHTTEEAIPHLGLVAPEKSLASIVALDESLFASSNDELHQPPVLCRGELQLLVLGRTTYGEDGEESPSLATVFYQQLLEAVELAVIFSVYAGYNVIVDAFGVGDYIERSDGIAPTVRIASYIVVMLLEAIYRECDCPHSGSHKRTHTLGR